MDRATDAAMAGKGGGRPILPATGDLSQLLRDPVTPHFELSSVRFESLNAEPILCLDCQSGILAVLNQTGTLQVIDVQEDALLLRTRVKNPHKLFLDPLGSFLLVTALDGEVYLYAIHEERLVTSFALHPPSTSGYGSAAVSSLASLSSRLRGTVHVGHCACWLKKEAKGPSASGAERRTVNLLMGTRTGGLVFYVRVVLGASGGSSSHGGKASVLHLLQLPDFFAGGGGGGGSGAGGGGMGVIGSPHVPVASIIFEQIETPDRGLVSFLAMSTPLQLFRIALPAKTAATADHALSVVASGGEKLHITSVTPPPPTAEAGPLLSSFGALSVFRSHAESAARSYAWSSVAGVVHGLFHTAPGEPLRPEEEPLFAEAADPPRCSGAPRGCLGEATISLPKVRPESRTGSAGHSGGSATAAAVLPMGVSATHVVLTAFHMILLYEHRCIVLNHPAGLPWGDQRHRHDTTPAAPSTSTGSFTSPSSEGAAVPTAADVVARIRFDPFRGMRHMESLKGVVRDAGERKLYVYGEHHVWELQMENEHRQQWRLFLDRAMATPAPDARDVGLSLAMRRRLFDAAYNLSRFHDAQRSVVQFLRGGFYLSVGAFDRATSVLADSELVEAAVADLLLPCAHQSGRAGTGVVGRSDASAGHRSPPPPPADLLVQYLAKRFALLARFRATHSDEEQQKQQREELVSFAVLAVGLASPSLSPSEEEKRLISDGAGTTAAAAAAAVAATVDSGNAFLDSVVTTCESALPVSEQRAVFDLLLHILEEQGRPAAFAHLAEKVGRYALVVVHHLRSGQDRAAIEVLARHTAGHPDMAEVWHRHARRLLHTCPIAAVTAMLKVCAKDRQAGRTPGTLQLERLLPAFAEYAVERNEEPDNTDHQIIILLEQCIHHFDCVSTAVHNFYIALLAAQGDVERLEEVIETSLFFDESAALRACLTHRCFPVCVLLYKRLGLFEDAVLTALQDDAPPPPPPPHVRAGSAGKKGLASAPRPAHTVPWTGLATAEELLRGLQQRLDEEAYKRLWQIIAEFAMERSRNARLALSVVDHSDGALQLADVLGSVDDSLVVQEFQGAICASLDRYSTAITQLRAKQEEAYHTAEDVKHELADLRHQFGFVTAKQRCLLCQRGLLHSSQPMLLYANCHHVVHERCAVKLLESIGGLDAFLTDEGVSQHLLKGVGSLEELAQVDCVICGEAAIVQADIPLCEEDPSWSIK